MVSGSRQRRRPAEERNMAKDIRIPIVAWTPAAQPVIDGFFARPAFPEHAERAAREILADVRLRGDAAVVDAIRRFDGAELAPSRLRVSDADIEAARAAVDPAFRKAAREADRRVARFSKAGKRRDWRMRTPRGGSLGERFTPLDRVGAYIPGGAAPLVSTGIMTVTLARVAGVPEIVACTPSDAAGTVNPYVLFALDLAGATEIYRIGGIQAIGAMAYGTDTVGRVRKIVGPGNAYVTAAKRQLYGLVDLDLVAGPSEIAVLADATADPRHAAVDLLSQLEHGTGDERALLITTSRAFAARTARAVVAEAASLPRGDWLLEMLPRNLLIVTVKNPAQAIALSNRFAPEHLELLVARPRTWLQDITHAGAVFLGKYTPESAGDFAAGPSHVLPTGGTAAMFSGLTVDTFRKRTSVIGLSRADLAEVLPVIEAFGRVEQLEAHARSARIRFESP
jgi:histidinol dehydrogenase